MKKKQQLLLVIIVVFTLLLGTSAQELVEDEEVDEIRGRVTEVGYEINPSSFEFDNGSVVYETSIDFQVEVELWNTYDTELTSYGSSSCRWLVSLDVDIEEAYSAGGIACTDDLSPRNYPSGTSQELSGNGILMQNYSETELPVGYYYISGGPGSYFNTTDFYFGLNLTVHDNGSISEVFEKYPEDWGDILYHKGTLNQISYGRMVPTIGLIFLIPSLRRFQNYPNLISH